MPRLGLPRDRVWWIVLILTLSVGVVLIGWFAADWRRKAQLANARTALANYAFEQAQARLKEYLLTRPDDPVALLLAAQAARRGGRLDLAREYLDAHNQRVEKSAEATLEFALQQAQSGEIDAVLDYLAPLVKADHPATEQILEALARGSVHTYQQQQAAFWIEALLERWPSNPIGRLLKAQTLHALGKDSEATEVYQALVQDYPDLAAARRGLATLLVRKQRLREALEHLRELVRLQPEDPAALVGLLRCLRQLNELQEEPALLARLQEEFPQSALARLEVGRAALAAGRSQEAEQLLTDAVRLAPHDLEAHFHLAQALRRNGKDAEAEVHLRRFQAIDQDLIQLEKAVGAATSRPDDPEPRIEAARICLRNGQDGEALRWLTGALRLNPQHGPTHAALADYYEKQGDLARAGEHRRLAGR